MRLVYRILAMLIAVGVVVQAATIAYALFDIEHQTDDGQLYSKDTHNAGVALHSALGEMAIPVIAVVLLIVSFFAAVPGGVKWAAITFGVLVLQVLLAYAGKGLPAIGVLHGINAFALAGGGFGRERPGAPGRFSAGPRDGAGRACRRLIVRRPYKIGMASVAALAIAGPLAYFWQASLVPSTYDMASMGYADFGGGPGGDHHRVSLGTPTSAYTGPTTMPAAVSVTLTARRDGSRYTLNGQTPGPVIRAVKGQLVQVTLVNANVPDGVTLHWHGVDVPNGEDGVAGITQDAVRPGQSFVYRFVVPDAGTYWYHSHQVSHEQVRGGLFGALIVSGDAVTSAVDQVAAVHTYDGRRTINGVPGVASVAARAGQAVRVRLINTDAGPLRAWVSGSPYRVVAIDGRPVHEPSDISDKLVIITAGGRVDVVFAAPGRVDVGAGAALSTGSATAAAAEPKRTLDLLSYGTPAPLGFDPGRADRHFQYRIGRRIGFLDGKPGLWWTVNGHLFPDVPMFMVSTGDIVRMTISNSSGEVHPMHLHGHHAVVLSRDGVAATGSPWWIDSLDVADGDTYEIAFVADNPGIWVDHCHNLQHAADGLIAHLAYFGVTTPYRVGRPGG